VRINQKIVDQIINERRWISTRHIVFVIDLDNCITESKRRDEVEREIPKGEDIFEIEYNHNGVQDRLLVKIRPLFPCIKSLVKQLKDRGVNVMCVLYTNGIEPYMNAVLEKLDSKRELFDIRLARPADWDGNTKKSLERVDQALVLLLKERNMHTLTSFEYIVADDRLDVWKDNRHLWICNFILFPELNGYYLKDYKYKDSQSFESSERKIANDVILQLQNAVECTITRYVIVAL
jgi:hypothetical protein